MTSASEQENGQENDQLHESTLENSRGKTRMTKQAKKTHLSPYTSSMFFENVKKKIRKSDLLSEMKRKTELCEELKKMERIIRAGMELDSPLLLMNESQDMANQAAQPTSIKFEDLVRLMERWRLEGAGEIELRATEEYLENIIQKVGPILGSVIGANELGRLGSKKVLESLDHLKRGMEIIKNYPFGF